MSGLEHQVGLWAMVAGAGLMVKLVLLVLLLLSVFSWAVILYKVNLLRKMERETTSFYDLLLKSRDLSQLSAATGKYPFTPLARLFREAYGEARPMLEGGGRGRGADVSFYVSRLLKKSSALEKAAMEKSINFLATTGSTAPFIGLFGTVWGIMNTFGSIGSTGAASIAVVAPGISEALIATAMGLFAAIPAVIGYNHILTRIDRISREIDGFSADVVTLFEKKLAGASYPEAKLEE